MKARVTGGREASWAEAEERKEEKGFDEVEVEDSAIVFFLLD